MLSRIEVRNFQSLSAADIELGQFTVITGPTGSGKSALFRAVRMLAFNAWKARYVTHGQASCSVTAGNGTWVARLTRSAGKGRNEYLAGRCENGTWVKEKYTKLARQVPPQVSALLALTELNFSSQGDPPYLLSGSGAEAARQLGELTNVSLVLGAAAEAGRVRKAADRDLAAARARRDALLAEKSEFEGLKAQRDACAAAEEALGRVLVVSARLESLRALTGRLRAAEAALEAAREAAARQSPPPVQKLEALLDRRARLGALARELRAAELDARTQADAASLARRQAAAAENEVHDLLAQAGACPVCGAAVA
jgi:DNA repair protein SbcC/Rad50